MNLFEQVNNDIKSAMLAQEKTKLEALRGVKKEFLEAKSAKGGDGELSNDNALKIITKLIKQRKDAAEIYKTQGREDLASKELDEVEFISIYLPKQLSEDEITAEIQLIISSVNAQGPKDMGKVMGVASKQLAGKAEGRLISEVVKTLLGS